MPEYEAPEYTDPRVFREAVLDRLVRIETRVVKIMESMRLDPRTGNPLPPIRARRKPLARKRSDY